MVTVDLSIFPVGKGEHLGKFVAKALDVIDKSRIKYQLGPMGTTIEGSWEDVFRVVKKCFEALRTSSPRVYGTLKVDYKFASKETDEIKKKVSSVQKALGRKLVTAR